MVGGSNPSGVTKLFEMYYAYVLKSTLDNRLYKGHTHNIEHRIKEHNSGKTKSTKGYIPWVLVYYETFQTKEEAMAREKYFKSGVGRAFLNKIIYGQAVVF